MFTPRRLVAVVVAGILGTIANSIVVAALTPNAVGPLILSFGRNAVAIIVALLLPVIFARLAGAAAWATGLVALTLIPSILAKTVFAVGAPWPFVIGVNAVYAVAAIVVYAVIAGTGTGRPSAGP